MYGINEKLFVIGLFVLFTTVVLGGVFSSQVAVLWIRNKREERRHDDRRRERDKIDQFEKERNAWYELAKEQATRIDRMSEELTRLTRDYENAKKLMKNVKVREEK